MNGEVQQWKIIARKRTIHSTMYMGGQQIYPQTASK